MNASPQTTSPTTPPPRAWRMPPFATALRQTLREGYGLGALKTDAMSGASVGLIAVPLSIALAIATGVAPQYGLYTAIIAGALIALFGGSRFQVSGPTAAFVAILAPIVSQHGVGGLMVASAMAGLMLLAMGLGRLGRFIRYIPLPVVTGFTAGIGLVIATFQVEAFLGLSLAERSPHYFERVGQLLRALPTAQWESGLIGALTLAALLVVPRVVKKIPAPLLVLPSAAVGAWLLQRYVPGAEVETVATKFSYMLDGVQQQGIPQAAPTFAAPWSFPGPTGAPLGLSLPILKELFLPAFTIAILGAIESLLSAVVADASTNTRHDPDAELIGQGIGNLAAPFFGGFAATGALARTAFNIRSGGRSPFSALIHAAFVLLVVLVLAPWLGHLPMSALAAQLFIVAWNMSEAPHAVHALKTSPRSDAFVLLTCFGLTVAFDMVVAVVVGLVLASFLFMKRMVDVAEVNVEPRRALREGAALDERVLVYSIAGPLFFGAAQKAMGALDQIHADVQTVIFDMRSVPAMDATGLVNFQSALDHLRKSGKFVVLTGLQPQPARVLDRAGVHEEHGALVIRDDLERAVEEFGKPMA